MASNNNNRITRQGSTNRVRGPNSALTEFLRSRGIRASDINARHRARQDGAPAQASTATSSSAATAASPTAATAASTATSSSAATATSSTATTTVIPATAVAEEDLFGAQPLKKKAGKRKKRYGEIDGSLYNSAPVPGQIEYCEKCNCRFTVTAYSKQSGDGLLCAPCGKKEDSKDKTAPKKTATARRARTKQMSALLDGQARGVPTLREIAINVIAKNIDRYEVEGALHCGSRDADRICQIISRNRALDDRTVKLFLDPGMTRLSLYDCCKISTSTLRDIGTLLPTLRFLLLHFCGSLRDEVLEHYGNQLKDLKGLELGGPFLVTKQAWCAFFENIGSQLEELTITDTFRIDSDVISSLVDNCPNLKELRLKQIVKLDDSCVRLLTGLTSLKVLELSDPGLDVTDAAIVDVLNSIGSGLQELNLAGCALLTVDTLLAIKACCRRLTSLTITEATSIHDADVESFFYEWKLNPGLRLLNFSRIGGINELAFDALLQHSANSLEVLNINSTKLPAAAWQLWGLNPITTPGRLRSLDVGFVRSVDDEVVERICDACGELVELKVWGDNRITQTVRLPEGVRIIGREADLHYQNLGAAADRVVIGD